jgi:hypothetical protein
MECLVGKQMARETMIALSQHHYCWVYRTVLNDEFTIADIIRKYDLLPEPLRHRDVLRVTLCDASKDGLNNAVVQIFRRLKSRSSFRSTAVFSF